MTREELHKSIGEVLYIEDFGIIDTLLASVIANSQMIGDPVWLTLIGPSSGGKSQLIRPIAKSNPKLFLQVDDMTANTFISGTAGEDSLIFRIKGSGIISMDDLTVLFSKNSEDRAAILSQFRMIYDGRLAKATGANKGKLMEWTGHAGMLAGSTPAIYRHFSEVSDMGERFINYRMRTVDEEKITDFVMNNPVPAKQLDLLLIDSYTEYIASILSSDRLSSVPELDAESMKIIKNAARVGTKMRTPVMFDDRDKFVSEIPVQEVSIRVMKQLIYLANAFMIMHYVETGEDKLPRHYINCLEWVAYSLSDDKRRLYAKAVLALEYAQKEVSIRNIAAYTGLPQAAVERQLPVLTAIGVLEMSEREQGKKETRTWRFKDLAVKDFAYRLDTPEGIDPTLFDNEEEL